MGREEALAREVVAKEHAQSDEHEQVKCTYACACFTRWRVCTATKVERCFVRMYVDKSALWTLLLLLHAMWQTMHRKLEREMVAVVVSSANRCFYCLVAHGQAVRALSGDPQLGEMLVMNYRVAPLSARQRAMLDFAWALTTAPWEVDAPHRAALRAAGLSYDEIFDLADVIGFFNMSNRFAIASDMMPNPEYHARDR